MKKTQISLAAFALLVLTACDPYDPTMRPDYVIRVTPTAQGSVVTPPACPSWATQNADPYDNQPEPQFGCSNARNLAAMVDNPDDLVQGRALGDQRGVSAVGAMRRYDNNQTRGLVWTGTDTNQVAVTTSSTGTSAMSGDVTGATPSAAPAAGPSAP